MKNEARNKIAYLTKKINKQKRLRDAYSFIGFSSKVNENNQVISDLETKLMRIKLDTVV